MGSRPPPEAVIVAGGYGTRLLPLTRSRPKHLLGVGGIPFLEHQILKLARAGVGHVVLATSYHAEMFWPVLGDGSAYGVRLSYAREEQPLGTAGALRHVAPLLGADPGGAVVVLNGDVLSGHDLRAQIADFEVPRAGREVEVSLHLVTVPDARAYGCVPTDGAGRVTAFVEKSESPVTDQVNAGCYVFARHVLDEIPSGRAVSVERDTFPALLRRGALVVGYLEAAYWRDVGTPEALVAASRDVVLGVAPSPAMGPSRSGARVHSAARVAGQVGGGSVVERDAVVEAGARVWGSVLMTGARVGRGATVVDSLVGPGARVGAGSRLVGVTLGDGAVLDPGSAPAPGTRVACGAAG